MIVGKVTGSIVSTRKSEKLIGNKFMIVEPLESMKSHADRLVAIDNIGAGIGEYVLVSPGQRRKNRLGYAGRSCGCSHCWNHRRRKPVGISGAGYG